MSFNKKAARKYVDTSGEKKPLKKNDDFIKNYINASNAATGSKYDSNANVSNKNVVTMSQELHKGENIQLNRYVMHNKIKALYSKKLADQYIQDLENHTIYRHDETGAPRLSILYIYNNVSVFGLWINKTWWCFSCSNRLKILLW